MQRTLYVANLWDSQLQEYMLWSLKTVASPRVGFTNAFGKIMDLLFTTKVGWSLYTGSNLYS